MSSPDDALSALREIASEFATFLATRGAVSEADTRAKLIDRVLKEVLLWPEGALSREDHVDTGFIDYTLTVGSRSHVSVEAKRAGDAFVLPAPSSHRTASLNGALMTDTAVRDAIEQVRRYCDSGPTRYAIATNGYTWIVFRAIREDINWRKGRARIFGSIDDIVKNFTEFWNLLSYEAICTGRLDEEFGSGARVSRELHRVRDRLFNADLPLHRNLLHTQIAPLVRAVFEDIADQGEVEILESCYVHSRSLRVVADDINCVITDAMPAFLANDGAVDIHQQRTDAGEFGRAVTMAVGSNRGQLFLLLGGVGAGKTTFLKRYQRNVGAQLLTRDAIWFHVNFLSAPLTPAALEDFFWSSVIEDVRSRYADLNLESWPNLKTTFARDISAIPRPLNQQRTKIAEDQIAEFLRKRQENLSTYVPKLVRTAASRHKKTLVLFLDNVDQLAPAYQAQIFMLAERITETLGSITIIAMREESYYTASIQKTFSAYSVKKFHIASPRFRVLIGSRIQYALKLLARDSQRDVSQLALPNSNPALDPKAIADFLLIVQESIFEKNKNIGHFIEAICFGNMRLALQMFATFLTSGATEVDKMLRIYRRDGAYYVAFHEFLKAIMLGERMYYKEDVSPILNLFECGSEKNAGHFTSLRLLSYLALHRGDACAEGRGYVDLSRVLTAFEDVFDNREEFIRCANRMLQNLKQLVEVNTRSTETIAGASHVRITSAGWYYLRFLANSFPYLDLVLQDTPLADEGVEYELRRIVQIHGNLGAYNEDEKIERLDARFERVAKFLEYLSREEVDERARFGISARKDVFAQAFMPEIVERFETQRAWIRNRLAQNREASLVELPDESGEQFEEQLYDDEVDVLDSTTEAEPA